jgi:hypothetical protein
MWKAAAAAADDDKWRYYTVQLVGMVTPISTIRKQSVE